MSASTVNASTGAPAYCFSEKHNLLKKERDYTSIYFFKNNNNPIIIRVYQMVNVRAMCTGNLRLPSTMLLNFKVEFSRTNYFQKFQISRIF